MICFLSSLPQAETSLAGSPAPLHCFGSPSGEEVERRPPGHSRQLLLAAYRKYLGQKPSGSTQTGLLPEQKKTHMPASVLFNSASWPFPNFSGTYRDGGDFRPNKVHPWTFPLESAGGIRPRAPRYPNM